MPFRKPLTCVCVVGLVWATSGTARAELPAGFTETTIVRGLDGPTAFQFAPGRLIFIAEKSGLLRVAVRGELRPEPVLQLPVSTDVERGLVGLAVDPAFATNGYVYVYYTSAPRVCGAPECLAAPHGAAGAVARYPDGSPTNRVSRLTIDRRRLVSLREDVLLDGIPTGNGMHNGGGLQFGPDGMLYVSTGDGGTEWESSQSLTSLSGKILRIAPDGHLLLDNPLMNNVRLRPEIWAYGLRNPWRFTFDADGRMFIGDVGGNLHEEINVGGPGLNFGWPKAEGNSTDSEYVDPVFSYAHDGQPAAIIVGEFALDVYPYEYAGRLFFADYSRHTISTMRFSPQLGTVDVQPFATDVPGVVHFANGPDRLMYYLSFSTGEIRRLDYRPGE